MSYKIVFLDIDGTVLLPDHTICPTTKDAIDQLHKQDILVFLATGRPAHGFQDLASELNIHSYIGFNGAYAFHQNETIINETMEHKTLTQIVKLAEKHGHEMVLYTDGINYYTTPGGEITKQFQNHFNLQQNDFYNEKVANQVLSTTIMNVDPEQLATYKFDPDIYLAQVNIDGLEHCYDIMRKNVHKGSAVQAVLSELNIPAEKAIAFGDGTNDKEMFQSVGASFVMENGHKDVFPYAKYKTTSSSESGIFNGLKKLGLVK